MHETFSVTHLHFISAYSRALLHPECKCDRSLIVPFRQLCYVGHFSSLIVLDPRIVPSTNRVSRSKIRVKLSEKQVFSLPPITIIIIIAGIVRKEQWRIGRFNLEFTYAST